MEQDAGLAGMNEAPWFTTWVSIRQEASLNIWDGWHRVGTVEPALCATTSLIGNAHICQWHGCGIKSLLKHVLWGQQPVQPVPHIRMSVQMLKRGLFRWGSVEGVAQMGCSPRNTRGRGRKSGKNYGEHCYIFLVINDKLKPWNVLSSLIVNAYRQLNWRRESTARISPATCYSTYLWDLPVSRGTDTHLCILIS